jgi:FAD synthetase
MASGVFDILHLGHLHYLEESKKLGPITSEDVRLELIKALKPVDDAFIGYDDDIYKIVQEIQPDVITLGYDQEHDEQRIKSELSKRGLKVEVKRLPKFDTDLDGTRKIIQKIIGWYEFQSKINELEQKGNGT